MGEFEKQIEPEQPEPGQREEQKPESEMTELELENHRLREENERLRQREEYRKTLNPKERMYDHVNVSVKTMDCIIAALAILFIIVIVMGMIK